MAYQINLGTPYWQFDHNQVKRIEPDAVYVADLAIKNPVGLWTGAPVAVFYTPTPRIGYTNQYFGLFKPEGMFKADAQWTICDASSVLEHEWQGLERDGEVIFSRWVHDYRSFTKGGPFVDGGPDYRRVLYSRADIKDTKNVALKIRDGKFKVVDRWDWGTTPR